MDAREAEADGGGAQRLCPQGQVREEGGREEGRAAEGGTGEIDEEGPRKKPGGACEQQRVG